MNWIKVDTSNIEKIAYKYNIGDLYIKCKNGNVGKFSHIGCFLFVQFICSNDLEKFLVEHIKSNFIYEKVLI